MKKIKSMLCVALLSTFLVGNVFAGGPLGTGVVSVFGNVVTAVLTLFSAAGECRPRDCQTCRPDQRDSDGNCRPTEG